MNSSSSAAWVYFWTDRGPLPIAGGPCEPSVQILFLLVASYPCQTEQSVVQRCDDPRSLIHHGAPWLLKFHPLRSVKDPASPDPVHFKCGARVVATQPKYLLNIKKYMRETLHTGFRLLYSTYTVYQIQTNHFYHSLLLSVNGISRYNQPPSLPRSPYLLLSLPRVPLFFLFSSFPRSVL